MSTEIKAFFNKRADTDTNAESMFCGVDGDVSEKTHSNVLEFLGEANRAYGIERVPALVMDPHGGLDMWGNIVPTNREVENQFHLIRSSDGHVVSPKTVSKQYAPFALADLAAEIQGWCDQGWATPDAVYDGKDGALELLTLRLDAGGVAMPDGKQWDHHIILRVPHGTGGKVTGTLASFCHTCANTYAAQGRGRELMIPHRISGKMSNEEIQFAMAERAQMAVHTFESVKEYIAGMATRMNAWQNCVVNASGIETLTDALLGIKKDDDLKGGLQNKRDAILNASDLSEFGTHGKTVADFVNAVTFYNSSPFADVNKKSQVSGVDRMIRNVAPDASGWKLEQKALILANNALTKI